MKLKHSEFDLKITIDLADGGLSVTVPVDQNGLGSFGIDVPYYRLRKFVVTNKEDLLKLIGNKIDELYQD